MPRAPGALGGAAGSLPLPLAPASAGGSRCLLARASSDAATPTATPAPPCAASPGGPGGAADRPGVETPSKVPRPSNKRLRTGTQDTETSSQQATQSLSQQSAVACCWAGQRGALLELALAESLSLLELRDIAHAAAVCRAWRAAGRSKALWALAGPRLGLAGRFVRREELSRRRSRGVVSRGTLLGELPQQVTLRTVDLAGANAGADDGLLPSVVREISLLRSLSAYGHEGIVRLIGVEVLGEKVHIVTEHLASSFAAWFAQPREAPSRLRGLLRDRFGQLLRAVALLHRRGIMHRNLSPPNVLLDPASGAVKLCDLAHGRAMDAPLRPYSPEDPKLRAQSAREARRLWYRAPELILRQPIYGPAVDCWSVGTLMAEAAAGEPLFPSDSEVDHLFRIFRLAGTPGPGLWPEAVCLPAFSVRFPVYQPLDLCALARMVALAGAGVAEAEARRRLEQRPEVCEALLRCLRALGVEGSGLLAGLLQLEPRGRCSAEAALRGSFLRRRGAGEPAALGAAAAAAAAAPREAPRKREAPVEPSQGSSQEATPATQVARCLARVQLAAPAPPSPRARQRRAAASEEREQRAPLLWGEMARLDAPWEAPAAEPRAPGPLLPSRDDQWSHLVDHVVSLANELGVGDFSLHLGVALLGEHQRRAREGRRCGLEPALAATACLKLADAFDEHSQEYFQREKAAAYQAAARRWTAAAILGAEKAVAELVEFGLHRPTAAWFLSAALDVASRGGAPVPREAAQVARLVADLALLDLELQRHPARLRAQCALLLALACRRAAAAGGGGTAARRAGAWALVRRATCHGNQREAALACADRTLRVLRERRDQWSRGGLRAVEQRHLEASRHLLPCCDLCAADLAEELLPEVPAPQAAADAPGAQAAG